MMFTTMPEILRRIYFQQRLRLSGHLNMLQLIDEEILFIRQAINCALIQSCRKPRFPHLLFPGSCAITATSGEAFEFSHSRLYYFLFGKIYIHAQILFQLFFPTVYAVEPYFSCAAPQLPADRSHRHRTVLR